MLAWRSPSSIRQQGCDGCKNGVAGAWRIDYPPSCFDYVSILLGLAHPLTEVAPPFASFAKGGNSARCSLRSRNVRRNGMASSLPVGYPPLQKTQGWGSLSSADAKGWASPAYVCFLNRGWYRRIPLIAQNAMSGVPSVSGRRTSLRIQRQVSIHPTAILLRVSRLSRARVTSPPLTSGTSRRPLAYGAGFTLCRSSE
jgi:hypothetical protein